MKKENQIKKRKALNELIQEIVDEQVEMMLLEYASGSEGALYTVFIQPFVDTANVIKGEVEKTGANLTGTIARGLLGAVGTLLPMFDKIPFTEKTWEQGIEGIKQYTNAAIKKVDSKYADSYKRISESFKNPDLAFVTFAFNPGLYLGTALATNTMGVALSTASSMLGTSGEFSNAYSNLLSTIGIFTPGFTPQGGGVSIDVGMGGMDGGMYENNSYRKLKNAISLLVEFQLYKEAVQDPYYKDAKEKYKTLINQIKANGFILDEISLNHVWRKVYEKVNNNKPGEIDNWISELKKINPEQIVGNKEEFINKINATSKTGNIINSSIDSLVKNLIDLVSKSQSMEGYPKTIEELFKQVDSSKNQEIKNSAIEWLKKNNIELKDNFKTTYNSLEEKQKNELKTKYPEILLMVKAKKQEIPESIKNIIKTELSKFGNNISEETKNEIVQRVIEGLNSARNI